MIETQPKLRNSLNTKTMLGITPHCRYVGITVLYLDESLMGRSFRFDVFVSGGVLVDVGVGAGSDCSAGQPHTPQKASDPSISLLHLLHLIALSSNNKKLSGIQIEWNIPARNSFLLIALSLNLFQRMLSIILVIIVIYN